MTQAEKLLRLLADDGKYHTMKDVSEALDVSKERARVIVVRLLDDNSNAVERIKDGHSVAYKFHSKPQKTKEDKLWDLAIFGRGIAS